MVILEREMILRSHLVWGESFLVEPIVAWVAPNVVMGVVVLGRVGRANVLASEECADFSVTIHPHSILRVETGVKTVKGLVMQNSGSKGSLDTDALALALLQYWNMPDWDTRRLPAQVVFTRKLRYGIPCGLDELHLRLAWVLTQEARAYDKGAFKNNGRARELS